MPKVTEEYIESKRRMIVDACYQVCLRKPVEMVTISDVIAETGMSQGAIYRYYNGLDDILSDLTSRMRAEYNMIGAFEEIISNKDASLEELTDQVCDCLAETMESHLMDIQKINFDFGSLAVNSPERMAKIMEGASGQGITEKIGIFIFPKMVEAAVKQGYKMNATPEEIGVFISAAFAGIEKCSILQANYATGSLGVKVEPRAAFRTLAKSIILLFGGTVNE